MNKDYSIFSNQQLIKVKQLFHLFDKSQINQVPLVHIVNYFKIIDPKFTLRWLQKLLIKDGLTLKDYIVQKDFIDIFTKIKLNVIQEKKLKAQKQEQYWRLKFSKAKKIKIIIQDQ